MISDSPWRGRLAAPDSTKAQRFEQAVSAAAEIVYQRGAASLSVSAVARRAGLSRAWVYKYIGAEPEALLALTARHFGSAFAGLGQVRPSSNADEWYANVCIATRDGLTDVLTAPLLVEMYFRHRLAPGVIGETLREVAREHRHAFVAAMPAELQRDPEGAMRFGRFFTASRMGAYHLWCDPSVRAQTTEDQALEEILRPLHDWLAGHGLPRPRPSVD